MQKTVQRTGYISGDNLKPEIIGEGASRMMHFDYEELPVCGVGAKKKPIINMDHLRETKWDDKLFVMLVILQPFDVVLVRLLTELYLDDMAGSIEGVKDLVPLTCADRYNVIRFE